MIGPPKTALEVLLAEQRRRAVLRLSEQRLVDRVKSFLIERLEFTLNDQHVVPVKTVAGWLANDFPNLRGGRTRPNKYAYGLVRDIAQDLKATIVLRCSVSLIKGAKIAGMTDEEAVSVSKFIRKQADPWEKTRDLTKYPKNRKRDAQKVTKKA